MIVTSKDIRVPISELVKTRLWQMGCRALVLLTIVVFGFFLSHPAVFPTHGFQGGEELRKEIPAGIRLTGDSYRYIEGGEKMLRGEALDATQRGYRGYIAVVACCLKARVGVRGLVALQLLASLATLAATLWLGRRLAGRMAGGLAGALVALNLDLAVWTTSVMTEAFYVAAVAIQACLCCLAVCKRRWWTLSLSLLSALVFAFIRPTGWILLPATGILLCLKAPWTFRWRWLGCGGVCLMFLALAFATSGEGGGISSQQPIEKLTRGEVVWRETLWQVQMPPYDGAADSYSDAALYVAKHPFACAWLALKRVGGMFLKVRPLYSRTHNLLLLAIYLPLLLAGLGGLFLFRQKTEIQVCTILTFAHALVVALTFNDYDGRFTLYIVPLLAVPAAALVLRAIRAIRAKHP